MNFDADLDNVFFADFGVAVSFGAATTKGIVDIVSSEEFGHSDSVVIGQSKTLIIKTGSLGNAKTNSVIAISGYGNFKILEVRFEDDGKTQKLYLADA